MFDSDLNEDVARQRVTRRAFLLSGGVAVAGVAAWSLHSTPHPFRQRCPAGLLAEITIAEFSAAGRPPVRSV